MSTEKKQDSVHSDDNNETATLKPKLRPLAHVVKQFRRDSWQVVSPDESLITGGYASEKDAANAARQLGYSLPEDASSAALQAYLAIYSSGFNPAGFAGFEVGFNAAHASRPKLNLLR